MVKTRIKCHKFQSQTHTVTLIEVGDVEGYLNKYQELSARGFQKKIEVRYPTNIEIPHGFQEVSGWVTPLEFLRSQGIDCYLYDGEILCRSKED